MSHATPLHHRSYLDDYMQIMHSSALPGNVPNEVYRQVQASALATVNGRLNRRWTKRSQPIWAVLVMSDTSGARRPAETRSGAYSGSCGPSMAVSPLCACPSCAAAIASLLADD